MPRGSMTPPPSLTREVLLNEVHPGHLGILIGPQYVLNNREGSVGGPPPRQMKQRINAAITPRLNLDRRADVFS